ncbi:NRDC protein, partial [Acromyrmex heyeri]
MSYKDHEEGSPSKRVKRDISKAFCGLCVRVGSFNDPPELPGLAHLLERMVFKGSKKYPENFNEYVSLYDGTTDSETDCEYTRFYFDISVKQLEPALDHFVQFFIDHPPLTKDAIMREREIIENEFQSSCLSCDKSRKERVLSHIVRIQPPPNGIQWKELTSYSNIDDDKLYEQLHKFRESQYSAHKMMLTIQARLPLDTLEKYVTDSFAGIVSNWLSFDTFTELEKDQFFDTVVSKNMYKIRSIQDISQLHVIWILPSKFNQYRNKPFKYISTIIENKESRSLNSYLRRKMWALDLSCGICDNDNGFGYNSMYVLFEIIVELSREGQQHLSDVLDAIFSFIKLVKQVGPQDWMYNIFYKIGKNNFRFFNKHDDVFDLCKSMHFYPSRDYLTGKHNYFEYNPEAIQECLNFLTPETMNIMNFGDDLDLDTDTPCFKAYCSISALPKERIEYWKSIEPLPDFNLPLFNASLIDNISLIPVSAETSKYPVKVYHDQFVEIWYRPKFYWPMCHINLHIVCSLKIETPKDAALLDMYCNVLKYLLIEELNPAVTVGFDYDIDVSEEAIGITIQMSGFGQKLPTLMIIAKYIVHLTSVSKDLFEVIKTQQLRAYYNKFMETEEFIKNVKLWILKRPYYTYVHKYESLYKYINFEDFQGFVKSFNDVLSVQCLVQGNITKDYTIDVITSFIKLINCFDFTNITQQLTKVAVIPPRKPNYYKLKNINRTCVDSVVTHYYQISVATIESSALIDLILMIMKESLINEFRTIGISNVSCDRTDINKILAFSITVYIQENKYTFEFVDYLIHKFVRSFRVKYPQFSKDKLDHVKERLRILKQSDDTKILKNEVNRNWCEITKQQYIFHRYESEALALENINMYKLMTFIDRHIDSFNLKKLRIYVEGTPKEIALSKQITFLVVRLQNGLTALLISGLEGANYGNMNYKDHEESSPSKRVKRDISKAFCGLCVRVGSFNDPPELPSLAHFLERMVFKGSKKYPENFNEYVSLYGGTTDSETDCEYTRFYFDISVKQLEPALDHFTVNIMNFGDDLDLGTDAPCFEGYCSITALPKERIEYWKTIEPLPDFNLTLFNAFLIDNISLIPVSTETSKYPVKVYHDQLVEIWYRPKFYWPMCHINLHIVCFLKIITRKDAVLLDMYCNVLKYLLIEELHPAVTAGFDYDIEVSEEATGITIQMSGFGEKLSTLLMVIGKHIVHLSSISKDLFEVIKTQQLRAYYNKFMETKEFIKNVKLWILKSPYYTYVHKYESLYKYINFEDFQSFVKSFNDLLSVQCLVQGNITKDYTIDVITSFIKRINCFNFRNIMQQFTKVAIIPKNKSNYYKLKNINRTCVDSVVTHYYQIGVATIESSALIDLILMIMKEPLINEFRIIGISNVSCDRTDINNILGFSITVYIQENKYTFEYLDYLIQDFLNLFCVKLSQFLEGKLDHVKERLRILKQSDDAKILKNEVNRNWSEITKQQYIFHRYESEALAIENIDMYKLMTFFKEYIDNSRIKKLRIYVEGTPKEIALSKQITFLFELWSKYSFL